VTNPAGLPSRGGDGHTPKSRSCCRFVRAQYQRTIRTLPAPRQPRRQGYIRQRMQRRAGLSLSSENRKETLMTWSEDRA
jgi:hypothetical protein